MFEQEIKITKHSSENLARQKITWRHQSWTIPELKGGKRIWFPLIKQLVSSIKEGEEINPNEKPDIIEVSNIQKWHSYLPFLKNIGLIYNHAGKFYLSETGVNFQKNPTKIHLANLIQNRFRLFAEFLDFLNSSPSSIKEVDTYFNKQYKPE